MKSVEEPHNEKYVAGSKSCIENEKIKTKKKKAFSSQLAPQISNSTSSGQIFYSQDSINQNDAAQSKEKQKLKEDDLIKEKKPKKEKKKLIKDDNEKEKEKEIIKLNEVGKQKEKDYQNLKENEKYAQSELLCTIYRDTEDGYFKQKAFQCLTCKIENESYICKICAESCHHKHNLKSMGIQDIYCDCPLECKNCQCIRNICQGRQKIDDRQPCCKCKTCKLSDICLACAAQCHKDHKIKFLGMEIFECWCGVRNEQKCQIPCTDLSIASEKSDSEENSIASQNSYLINCLNQYWNDFLYFHSHRRIDPNVAEYDDFEIVQKLFGGVMGKTFLVMLKTTGKLYVMKRVDYLDEKDKMKADEEVEQMRRLSSKFTVHLVYTFVDRTDQYQITEFCSRGDLRKQINELQKLSEKERLIRVCELFTQIILALNFMHSMGVIHRDIKPENIFIMEDGTVRLGDFGLSKVLESKDYTTVAGTRYYFAPEVFLKKKMYFQTDIYSCGIVFCELLTGQHPFIAENDQQTIENITNGRKIVFPEWIPNEIQKIIKKMLKTDYKKRPLSNDLMKLEIIKKNIEKFDEQERKLEKQQRQTQMFSEHSKKVISIQQLKIIHDNIKQLRKSELIDEQIFTKLPEQQKSNIFKQLGESLYTIRPTQTNMEQKITNEMQTLSKKIINNACEIIVNIVTDQNDVEKCFKYQIIVELIDYIKRKQINKMSDWSLDALYEICEKGTDDQAHRIFKMDAFKILTPLLKNKHQEIQENILRIFIILIVKGWKQYEQTYSQTQSLSSPITSTISSTISSDIPSSNSSSIISAKSFPIIPTKSFSISSSIFSCFSYNLQQLLSLNEHPYQLTIEKQGIIRIIIDDILMNKKISYRTKSIGISFLDDLYVQGAKLPSEVQQQLISDFCEQIYILYKNEINEEDEKEYYEEIDISHTLNCLNRLAINKDNHESIIGADFIEQSLDFFQFAINYYLLLDKYKLKFSILLINQSIIRKIDYKKEIDSSKIENSLDILQNLFIYGNAISRKFISRVISKEIIDILKRNKLTEMQATILECTFIDPQTVDFFLRLQRVIYIRSQQDQVELIKEGLINMLINEMEKASKKDKGLGIIILIGENINILVSENQEANSMVINDTEFVEKYILFLSSFSPDKIRRTIIYPLSFLSKNNDPKCLMKLFDKGVIQTLDNMFVSEDGDFRCILSEIILNIVEAGTEGLKQGEQHPYNQQLQTDKSIYKLVQAFKNEYEEETLTNLQNIIGSIYKAAPLPSDIKNTIVQFLKKDEDFQKISYLSECPVNDYEKKFFKKNFTINYSIPIIHSLLRYGNDANKKKVISAIIDEILRLNDNIYLDKQAQNYHWEDEEVKEIKIKTTEIIRIINETIGAGIQEAKMIIKSIIRKEDMKEKIIRENEDEEEELKVRENDSDDEQEKGDVITKQKQKKIAKENIQKKENGPNYKTKPLEKQEFQFSKQASHLAKQSNQIKQTRASDDETEKSDDENKTK